MWLGGEEAGMTAAGELPKESLFSLFKKFFLLNPAAPYKEGPVLSHSPPLQLDRGLCRSGPITAQLTTLYSWHTLFPWVYHFILIPLPVTSSNQVSLGAAQTLFAGEGAINLALSQESCGRPYG